MNVICVNISVKYEVNRTVRGSQCCIGDEYNSCGEGAVEEGRQSKGWAHARPRNMIYAARRHPKSRATTRTRCSAGTKFFMCCSTRSALCGSNEKITKTCCVCVCVECQIFIGLIAGFFPLNSMNSVSWVRSADKKILRR